MTYDFFADKSDKKKILDFIFNVMHLRVYDLYSKFSSDVVEYKSADEISSLIDLDSSDATKLTFQLWKPEHKGEPFYEKFDLNPKYCQGHTFRHRTVGWGLIQLYFGSLQKDRLVWSHIGHFGEKGALVHESNSPELLPVSAWDWAEVKRTSGRLKYHIHNKLAIRKIGRYGVLEGADRLEKAGIFLR